MSIADLLTPQETIAGALPTGQTPTKPAEWSDWSSVEQASFESTLANFNTNSRFWGLEEQRQKRDQSYQELTGESVASLYSIMDEPQVRREKIDAKINELRQKDKKFLTLATESDIESLAIMQARGSTANYEKITGNIEPGFVSGTAGLVGGLRAGLLDPVNLATAGFGAGAGRGFLQAVGIDFLLGTAATAATEPFVADWQATVGNKMTAEQVVTDIAAGGVLSGGITAVGRGIGKAYRFARTEALDRMAAQPGLPAEGKAAIDLMERDAFVRERNPIDESIDEADNIHRDNIDRAAMAVEAEGDFSRFVPDFDEKQLAADLRAGSAIADEMGYRAPDMDSAMPDIMPAKPEKAPENLTQFIARNGGIADDAGELRSFDFHKALAKITRNDKSYYGPIVAKKGKSLDYMREAAAEAGFIKPDETIPDFIEAIKQDYSGQKVYADAGSAERMRGQKGADADAHYAEIARANIEQAAKDMGVTLTPKEFDHAYTAMQNPKTRAEDAVSDALERSGIMSEPEHVAVRDKSVQQIREDIKQAQTGSALRARQTEADALLRDMPDMEIEIENADGTTARLTVKELMEQNKANDRMLAEISSCALGGTAGAAT